jgi:hypothetical protein
MYVRTKSTLHKKPKSEIQRPQGRALYVDDRLIRFKLSAVTHKVSQQKKVLRCVIPVVCRINQTNGMCVYRQTHLDVSGMLFYYM